MELIDRAETLYLMREELPPVDDLTWYENASPEEMKKLVDRLYEIVLNQPEIAAVPLRHGKWKIYKNNGIYDTYKCSCCVNGKITITIDSDLSEYKYCPNCGAKMDKE